MNENTSLPEEKKPESAATAKAVVCDIQFRPGSKIYFFDPNGISVKPDDHVIIDTSRGDEFGICTAGPHTVTVSEVVLPLRKVLRIATAQDERINAENKEKEKAAYATCLEKIEELKLEMQLVSAECSFDGSKLLFFFTAENRVDFRELVRILAAAYHTRIELRQIGVRDKAKMVGGFGVCGRPFCCTQFLETFAPVSIKMAKTQSLSLNPAKISGTCGKLMCCLKYEQEAYEDLLKTSPKQDSLVDTPDGRGTVTDVNLMAQTVKVRMEKDCDETRCYRNCDICVLRSGKAKKTDEPVPDDYAPISGGKKKPEPDVFPRFERRRTVAAIEAIENSVEIPAAAAAAAAERIEKRIAIAEQDSADRPKRQDRGRRRRGGKDRREQTAEKQAPQAKPANAEKAEQKPAKQGKPAPEKAEQKPANRPEGAQTPEKAEKSGNRRSRGRRGGRGGKPAGAGTPQEQKQAPQAKPAPQAAAPKPANAEKTEQKPAEGGKNRNKKRYYHHRKPGAPKQ